MVLQAWGNYGTAWPVVHQQLGVRPDAGRHALEVVPQVPGGQTRVAGASIRLGDERRGRGRGLAVRQALHDARAGGRADHEARDRPHAPAGATVASATLDGSPVTPETRTTNRGLEVTVPTGAGTHTLVVTTS